MEFAVRIEKFTVLIMSVSNWCSNFHRWLNLQSRIAAKSWKIKSARPQKADRFLASNPSTQKYNTHGWRVQEFTEFLFLWYRQIFTIRNWMPNRHGQYMDMDINPCNMTMIPIRSSAINTVHSMLQKYITAIWYIIDKGVSH